MRCELCGRRRVTYWRPGNESIRSYDSVCRLCIYTHFAPTEIVTREQPAGASIAASDWRAQELRT